MRGVSSGGRSAIGQRGRGGDSPGIEQQNLRGKNPSSPIEQKLSKKRWRNRNWSEGETTDFIECISRYRKGKIKLWDAIVEEMKKLVPGFTRTKEECQGRLDTLKKAQKKVKSLWGVKQFFQMKKEERSGQLSTLLKVEWYETLEQIEQQEKKPSHLSSSNSGGTPSLSGTQTPSRSDLAEDAGSSGTDLISSPENSPSPDSTQFQDPAVPYQTHSSESAELPFQQMPQGPATPNCTGVAQVVHPKLHDGEDSGAVCLDHAPCAPWTLKSMDKFLQEDQDCYNFSAQYFCKDIPLRIEQCGESSSILLHWYS